MSKGELPTGEEFQRTVHGALTAWHRFGGDDDDLLSQLLLVRERRAEFGGELSPSTLRQITNSVLEDGLEELARYDKSATKVLRARFIDGEITRQVANRLHASPDQVNRWQRMAIANLSEILWSRELKQRESRTSRLLEGLPPPTYGQLFGLDEVSQSVIQQLLQQNSPWVMAIVGIGGIGKTSLADAVARIVAESLTFDRVAWLRAGSQIVTGSLVSPEKIFDQILTQLSDRFWPTVNKKELSLRRSEIIQQTLKSSPNLIIIDNLETVETTDFILERLQMMANPSKVLLTTRARPSDLAPAFIVSMEELPFSAANALLYHHAESIGLVDLSREGNTVAQDIFNLTGGNPLALKLVVSLAAVLPLPQILRDLGRSRPGPTEDLYRNIYWESWKSLSEDAQTLLQAMPLVAESGALPSQMMAISTLTEQQFWSAVSELVSRSLLEVQGTVHERRYSIHRLTETFLRTEIIHWSEH